MRLILEGVALGEQEVGGCGGLRDGGRSREKSKIFKQIKENQTIKRMSRGGKRLGAGRKPIAVKSIAAKGAARTPAPQRSRKSKKVPPQTSAKSKLTPRQTTFLHGIAELKSQERAALDAGYSPSTARHAHRILEGANVSAEFQKILLKWVDPYKIGQRIAEGLDAVKTKFCQRKGVVTDSRDLVDYCTRRRYIVLAVKYAGYYVEGQEEAVEQVPSEADDNRRIAELLALAIEREEELARSKPTN
jgi:hypothetical protein